MFDRVLLILLLLLLPLGIVISRVVTGEMVIGGLGTSVAVEEKLDAMMEKVNQGLATGGTPQAEFTITGVVYATESGILKIAGMAPEFGSFIWVWTAATSDKSTIATATVSSEPIKLAVWDGPVVIRPSSGGIFGAEVETKAYAGVVEVRLEQGKATSTVRYDLDKKIQLNQ